MRIVGDGEGAGRGRAGRAPGLLVGLGLALLALVALVAWLGERPAQPSASPASAGELGAGSEAVSAVQALAESDERVEPAAQREILAGVLPSAPDPVPFRRDDLYGTVLDRTTRAPVADAIVLVFGSWAWLDAISTPDEERKTDEHGRFRFPATGPFTEHNVIVVAGGYALLQTSLRSGHAHEVLLDPALSVAGRVLHAESLAPAADVGVWVHHDSPLWSGRVPNRLTTDSQGLFRLQDVPAKKKVALYFGEEGRFPDSFVLTTGEVPIEGLELRLGRANELRLRAIDLESGVPLGDLRGRIEHVGSFRTDGAGGFVVRHDAEMLPVINGGILIEVEPEHACRTRILVPLDELEVPHDVPITRGARIEGRVSAAAGRPIAGAVVRLNTIDPLPESPAEVAPGLPPGVAVLCARRRTAESDDAGAFAFENLFQSVTAAGSRAVELRVFAGGWMGRTLSVEVPPPGASLWVDLVLDPGAAVRGRVLQAGEPLAGAVVYAVSEDKEGTDQVFTNDGGEYAFTSQPPGPTELTVQSFGFGLQPAMLAEEWVTLASGETLEHDLHVEDQRLPIEGTVRDQSGALLSGVLVTTRRGGPAATTRTLADGSFRLLVSGEHSPLEVVAFRGTSEASALVAPETLDVELVLPVVGRLVFQVVGREGAALPALSLVQWWPAGASRETAPAGRRLDLSAAADGRFELSLPVGRWDLELRASFHAPAALLGVEIDAERPAERQVTMRSGTTVELVFAGDGPPPPAAALRLLTLTEKARLASGDQPGPSSGFFAQPDGTLISSGHEPGPHVLVGIPEGWSLEPQRFEVPEVERHRVLMRWERLEGER